MLWFRRAASALFNLLRVDKLDGELDRQVDSYFDLLVEEKIQSGLAEDEARRHAALEMEGVTQVKEKTRESRAGSWFFSLAQDIRYSWRILARKPSFTVFALLTLAIGIGINTALFSVVYAALLQPLPYEDAGRLTIVWSVFAGAHINRAPASGPELHELQTRSRLFSDFAGIWVGTGALVGDSEPEQIKLGQVTANFFAVLGVKPALGRGFLREEEGGRGPRAVILGDGLWRRRYGADPQIVGKSIRTAGTTLTVVGVMPHGFELIFPPDASVPTDIQAWTPFPYSLEKNPADLGFLRVVGRLRPGVRLQQAQAELDGIARDVRAKFPALAEQQLELKALPLQADAVKDVQTPLLALFAGVGLVLLIGCANVANLLLARAGERTREMTMRSALGASRSRMIRQLLTESVLLSVLGAALGVLLAEPLLKLLPAMWPGVVPRLSQATINLPTLLFTVALSLITGMIFGLAPAIGASKIDLVDALKQSGKELLPGRGKLRQLLMLAEVGLSFVLLVGAGLMLRTFVRLLNVNPGFNTHGILTFAVSLPGSRYPNDLKRVDFLRRMEAELTALPGVEAAGSVSHLPFDDFPNWYSYYFPEGTPKEQQNTRMADHRSISPSFFRTFSVPLLAGRYFNERDDDRHPRVVIVDDMLAQETWPGQDPLGKKLNVEVIENDEFKQEWAQVVGVVHHIRYHSLMRQVRPQVYQSYMQCPRPQMQMAFAVRTKGNVESLVDPIRNVVTRLDKDLPISKVRPLDAYIDLARTQVRFITLLSAALGGIALLLACIGIYGVTSCVVAQSTKEIGLRLALGAVRADILRLVLRNSMAPILLGVLTGVLCSAVLAPLLSSLLFEVRPLDALTFSLTIVIVLAVALLACIVPARRASRMDPLIALRYE